MKPIIKTKATQILFLKIALKRQTDGSCYSKHCVFLQQQTWWSYTCHVLIHLQQQRHIAYELCAALYNACILFDLTHDSGISWDILWTRTRTRTEVSTSIWLQIKGFKWMNMQNDGLLQRCSIHMIMHIYYKTTTRDLKRLVFVNISRRR